MTLGEREPGGRHTAACVHRRGRSRFVWAPTSTDGDVPSALGASNTWGNCMNTGDLFADDPVDGTPTAPDRLSRATFADHVVTLLDRVRNQSDSSVLSLIGAWGSGKSSVLDMVQLRLRKATAGTSGEVSAWRVVNFNPWTYGDAESLQNGFFRELRNALPDDAQWSEARKNIGDFGKAIAPLAGLIPGVSAENAVKAAGDAIAGDQSVSAMKTAAEKALSDFGRPILFVMDDLDRLTPAELLLVFKLVRLVGRLPHVYYLLSYDESTLLDVLSRTDLVPLESSRDKRRARDYLEKIIQVRLDLPGLREQQAVELVDESLTHVLQSNSVSFDEPNMNRFRTAFHDHIRQRLDTPRAINRYFAQVDALYVLLGEEIDFVDFLFLTWIRTSEPELYAVLQSRRAELTRQSFSSFTSSASKETHQEALTHWTNLLAKNGVAPANIDGVLSVLSQMFLPIRSARENMEWTAKEWYDEIRTRRGVGHIDYFDRYFSFSVPDDDIPDSVVRAALSDLASGSTTQAVEQLRSRLVDDPGRVCRKIATEYERDPAPAADVLVFLADVYEDLPESGTALLDPKRSVQFLAADLLTDVSSEDGSDVLRRMSDTAQGVCLMADVVVRARHGSSTDEGKKTIDWIDEAMTTAADLIRSRLDSIVVPIKELDEDLWRLIYAWRWLDEEATRQWVREAAHAKSGWQLADILARMTAPERMDGGSMAALNMAEVETLVGVDFAIRELPMDDAERVVASYALEPTWENRQLLARSLIDEERQNRASASSSADNHS